MNNDFWNEFIRTLFIVLCVLTAGMVSWWMIYLWLGYVIP